MTTNTTTTDTLALAEIKAMFNNSPVEVLKISDLELHAGTQQRSKENTEAKEAYLEAMANGEVDNFPAIRVVRLRDTTEMPDGSTLEAGALVLTDGFTRIAAAEACNIDTFRAEVVDGTLDEAVKFSWVANSMHGSKLDQKDYQALIAKIYKEDPSLQKGYIARMLGCSAKTVSKACKEVEEAFKRHARTLMDNGFSDKEIAAKVFKSEQTIKNWREAYEAEKAQPEPEPKPVNPMKLKFEAVLGLDDLEQQKTLLDMLQARYNDNLKAQSGDDEEPSQQQQGEPTADTSETPQEAAEEQESLPWEDEEASVPAPSLEDMSCWDILGRSKDAVAALANPKASLRRTLRALSANGEHSPETYQQAFDDAVAELAE